MPKYELFTTAEVPSVDSLRSYVGSAKAVTVSDYSSGGVFVHDEADTSSAHDGVEVVVDYKGRRWKRVPTLAGSVTFTQSGSGAVSRTAQAKMRDIISWKDFGAIGDNASHPLSGTYASLGAAQADYPHATSLTQEIDWAAIQACINACNALGGAMAFGPAGDYINGADTLTMKKWVTLQGSGKLATEIKYSGTGDAMRKVERVNSSVAVHTSVRDLGITMTNASATGGCYVDVGGTFAELLNVALTGGKFGVVFDQTELSTIRGCDIEAQLAGGAGVWLVNGPDHSPGITLTAAPAAGATSGTLTANWTGLTGTYNLDFIETVGGAHESRMGILTNGSTAVTWVGGLDAACNAATDAAASQFTNRILVTETQFNNGAVAYTHIVDDGGVAHEICFNNFNSGVITANPPVCRFAGVLRLTFFSNYMEGGQTMLYFASTTNFTGSGAGGSAAVSVRSNIISMSQPNTPIVLTASTNPFELAFNWIGNSAASVVTGIGFCTSVSAPGNIWTSGTLFDSEPTYLNEFDNNGNRVNKLTSFSGGIGYGTGAGGTVTQAAGSKANGVTLNKITGEIVLSNANIAANTTVLIPFVNSMIGVNDEVSVWRKSGGTAGAYKVRCDSTAAGSCQIAFENATSGALAEVVTLQFAVRPSVVA